MRVLVCGDRDWSDDHDLIALLLDGFYEHYLCDLVLIEGGASGADEAAAEWAAWRLDEANWLPFAAAWDQYGKAAGPIRNIQMLDEGKPDVVLAFHNDLKNSKGTKHMVEQARAVGVPVYLIQRLS